ncbi:uncharacterized protein LOC144162944 [Haemaphysalis longicornis]
MLHEHDNVFALTSSWTTHGTSIFAPVVCHSAIDCSRKNQQQPGVRPPLTPFLAKTGHSPGKTRSSPPSIPSRPPSTVACGSSSSFDDDDDDDKDGHSVGDKNERYRSADPRLHEPHLFLDEGGGACVVVVSPRPMAAAAAAASQRQNRRHRPPTPIEGDGFPSITEEPIKARTIRPAIIASSSGPFATSSFICHPAGPSTAGRGSSRRSAGAESSYDGRSSSRSSDRRPVAQEFHQPKRGARVLLAVLVGSSALLFALLLSYNTQFEQDLIRKLKLAFERRVHGKRQDAGVANSTNSTRISVDAKNEPSQELGPSGTDTSTITPLPEGAEEFDQRLRQMVSRFWTPRQEGDYGGNGGLAFGQPPTKAKRRGWRGRNDDEAGGAPDSNNQGRLPDSGSNEPTEPLMEPPVVGGSAPPLQRTNWFLVQARRRHVRLPSQASDGGGGKSGNGSLDSTTAAVEIEQFWQEGDDSFDEDSYGHHF